MRLVPRWVHGASRRRPPVSLQDSRFRQYGKAMGWTWDENRGRMVGEVGGWPVSAHEDEVTGDIVVVLHTPARMSPLVVRPRVFGKSVAVDHDGLTSLMTGDAAFDAVYEVRAAEPWFALLVLSAGVRASLVAAPVQQWATDDDLVSVGPALRDPLDLLARMAALTAVLESVPWEAYDDPGVPPSREEVAAAIDRRRHRLRHHEERALSQRD